MILKNEDRKLLIEILKKFLTQDYHVYAFGSRVIGNAHEASDLDLFIIHQTNESVRFQALTPLREALRESPLPIQVDLHDWATLPTSFRNGIANNKEKIL